MIDDGKHTTPGVLFFSFFNVSRSGVGVHIDMGFA